MLIFHSKLAKVININDFYKKFDIYVPCFYFDFTSKENEGDTDNIDFFEEIIEIFENNMWKHEKIKEKTI